MSRSPAATSPRWHVRAERVRRGDRRCVMAVAGGLDLHRGQLTFDYIDLGTGESCRGRISPANRESLRGWLRRFDGTPEVDFAVEGCTGWRYVVEELQRADITAHLAEPAQTADVRGSKRRAKPTGLMPATFASSSRKGGSRNHGSPRRMCWKRAPWSGSIRTCSKSAPAGSSGSMPRCFTRALRWCPNSAPPMAPGGWLLRS